MLIGAIVVRTRTFVTGNAANYRLRAVSALRFSHVRAHTSSMFMPLKSLLLLSLLLPALPIQQGDETKRLPAAEYTSDGQLKFPEHYREWVYLTSGFDMSYTANARSSYV